MPNSNSVIHRQQARDYYHRNKESINEKLRACSPERKEELRLRKKKDRLRHIDRIKANDKTPTRRLSNAKSRAKSRGLEWTIELKDYVELIQQPCFYCQGFFGQTLQGSGLDRILNNLGYSIDNVLSCCGFCNRLRSDVMTVKECEALISLLITMRKNDISDIQNK